jgi:hypothetical protein
MFKTEVYNVQAFIFEGWALLCICHLLYCTHAKMSKRLRLFTMGKILNIIHEAQDLDNHAAARKYDYH